MSSMSEPSRGDLKATPRSVISARCSSDTICDKQAISQQPGRRLVAKTLVMALQCRCIAKAADQHVKSVSLLITVHTPAAQRVRG